MAAFLSLLSMPQVTLGKFSYTHLYNCRLTVHDSGGLATSGDPSGMCSSSPGQVYARAGAHNGAYAIMYSWYMPKDSPGPGLGHRHDWENIVVWLSAQSTTATIRGVAISAHGDYQKVTKPNLDGTRPLIGYRSIFPVNHLLLSSISSNKMDSVVSRLLYRRFKVRLNFTNTISFSRV